MVKVKFTAALSRFFPGLQDMEVEGNTIAEIIEQVDKNMPGISGYLLEDDGSLRKHVNIFLDDDLIEDRASLTDSVGNNREILIYQALSGG